MLFTVARVLLLPHWRFLRPLFANSGTRSQELRGSRHQIPQHIRQYAAVLEVIHFDAGINAQY